MKDNRREDSVMNTAEVNCRRQTKDSARIDVFYGAERRAVAAEDIMYIQMTDHYGNVYISDGTKCLWRKPLSVVQSDLSGLGFERCQNSYIVNMLYVRERIKKWFILTNGQSIPIGRKYSKMMNSKYGRIGKSEVPQNA